MLAALAGVVHNRQRADGRKHNRDEDNDQGALHGDLAPPATHDRIFVVQGPRILLNPIFILRLGPADPMWDPIQTLDPNSKIDSIVALASEAIRASTASGRPVAAPPAEYRWI